jgi:hypothetical protein
VGAFFYISGPSGYVGRASNARTERRIGCQRI